MMLKDQTSFRLIWVNPLTCQAGLKKSRLTLTDLLSLHPLRVAARDLGSGSGLTANRKN
jgi:hypothetical protein